MRSQRRERRAQTRRRAPAKRAPLPKAKRELLVEVDVGEQRVAILEDDRPAEVYLERPERRSIAGNIYLGTVDNVLPGMEAAFVEIGLEKNGFLYVDEIVVPELEGKRHGRKIQDLIKRGEQVLVQAVKDPMKSKGARLTTEISLPGRFVVYVPFGEGLGVSRRLEDDERNRLKEIVKALKVKEGGVIVRTAAEGASAEDVERDLVFLQRLWKSIQERAKNAKPPALVYQESELPLRVTRDLFTDDFDRALVDDDTAYKRIVGYLKKTSPHMVERVERYKEKEPLFETFGVDAEIRSTLNRRVDLPSGGYLVFDYAEAFTVIDVNTGRFVGGRGKNTNARLEDTITKNNLEAVKEVVRQLRLRDIGGIIVIDFIDMANPANRAAVEEALRAELERDRTKTYVVEISPLGLVEMTRQNVTDGPREILTKKCPTCGGDGIVVSETTAAVELERKLRTLAASKPRTKAFRIEVAAKPGTILIGPGASRLEEIEAATKTRFFFELKDGLHNDHFAVVEEGTLAKLQPVSPVAEGTESEVKLVEVGLHDPTAAIAKVDGLAVSVAGAAKLVGKRVNVRIARVLDGIAYATLVQEAAPESPITAEREAEKPTRAPRAKKKAEAPKPAAAKAAEAEEEAEEADEEAEAVAVAEEPEVSEEAPAPKKKTRRGSRGGRRRRKPATAGAPANGDEPAEAAEVPKIHLPDRELDEEPADSEEEPVAAEAEAPEGDEAAPKPKKKTRRGSRGGRRRRKPAGTPAAVGDADAPTESVA
ncbi:MAG TPA: Rne/Rng family ribonuclease [Gaiellaceae bacterium]|nr:Rne/Rng family ribonuclease [Gaiellaceae bacterium]